MWTNIFHDMKMYEYTYINIRNIKSYSSVWIFWDLHKTETNKYIYIYVYIYMYKHCEISSNDSPTNKCTYIYICGYSQPWRGYNDSAWFIIRWNSSKHTYRLICVNFTVFWNYDFIIYIYTYILAHTIWFASCWWYFWRMTLFFSVVLHWIKSMSSQASSTMSVFRWIQ